MTELNGSAGPAAAVRVRVPATSANLGPGFDTLGLALGLHDVVEARAWFGAPAGPDAAGSHSASPGALTIEVTGAGAGEVPRDESHLVWRAMRSCFAALGASPSRVELSCHNAIPHGRGLGSSAAAIVAGMLAARGLVTGGDAALDDAALLDLACRFEGHPDNVAPCLLGGFTIAWMNAGGVARVSRTDVHPEIRPVVCVPPEAVSTGVARGLLPTTVPHSDAAFNAGRAALLVDAMTRRPELLFEATEDRLHQGYREPAMPATARVISALRARGLAAVVSGAGPSILVLARADEAERVTLAEPGWEVHALPVDQTGAVPDIVPLTAPDNAG